MNIGHSISHGSSWLSQQALRLATNIERLLKKQRLRSAEKAQLNKRFALDYTFFRSRVLSQFRSKSM